jgi:hypothetical protein
MSGPLRAMRQFLTQRLRLVRKGLQVIVLLEPSREGPRATAHERAPRSEALRRDFDELRQLLGRHAHTRRALPHLGQVEQILARIGSRGLFKLPIPLLEAALVELEAVEQGLKLEELRARLTSAIETLRYQQAKHHHDVEVTEATHSVFSELERTWTAPMPLENPS